LHTSSILAALVGLLAAAVAGYAVSRSGGGTMNEGSANGAPAESLSAAPEEVPNQIVIDNFKFQPRRLTVKAGTKVTWVNRDDVPHTATSTARPRSFDSKTLDTDQRFSHVFKTAGTYKYFCAVHPHMTGEIVVK
jgi:plastocyanin